MVEIKVDVISIYIISFHYKKKGKFKQNLKIILCMNLFCDNTLFSLLFL